MILQPLLDATLDQVQPGGNTPPAIVDFLRPLFLKEDPADGARTFDAFLEAPGAKNARRVANSILRRELEGHPESVHKLEKLLAAQGSDVSGQAREAGEVTDIL